jgi:ribosomal protein S12 methylthiotransferase
VKEARRERFMTVQARISADRLKLKVGQTMTVLVDEVDEGGAVGRSAADAPEIDGLVHMPRSRKLKAGEFAKVIVEDADEHDLYARVA